MPQGLGKNLYLTLSVFENVDFFGRLFGHAQAERHQRIAELLASTGLAEYHNRPAGKLSGGMKQKLALCCALIHDPDLLVLDEPTSGVDPVARDKFWELIVDLARRDQVTVFISTHFMNEAERCDRISLMHAGKVLASDAPAALVERNGHATLEQAFIAYLKEAGGVGDESKDEAPTSLAAPPMQPSAPAHNQAAQPGARFSLLRLYMVSVFTRSQIAAIFATFLLTFIPSTRFSGMIDPVSSLEDGARLVGEIFPGTYFLIFSRGIFSKALGFAELSPYLLPLALSILLVVGLSVLLLAKQER